MSSSLRLIRKRLPVKVLPVSDARIEDLQKNLNINRNLVDLADADVDEIRQRQSICKWLLKHPNVINSAYFTETQYLYDTFPESAENFLRYQQKIQAKQTEFWLKVERFCLAADSLYLPPERINNLLNHIEREGGVKYREELDLANEVLSELRKTIRVAGILRFDVNPTRKERIVVTPYDIQMYGFRKRYGIKDIKCFGTWPYHPNLDPKLDPTRTNLEKILYGAKLHKLSKWVGEKRHELNLEGSRIYKTPPSIASDIALFLEKFFSRENGFTAKASFQVYIGYTFGPTGLHITLQDWEIKEKVLSEELRIYKLDYGDAYKGKSASGLRDKLLSLNTSREDKRQQVLLNDWFLQHEDSIEIGSPYTYEVFCSPKFNDVRAMYSKRIGHIVEWQKKNIDSFDDLTIIRDLAMGVKNSGLKYTFPEIVEDDQVLCLDRLYPVRVTPQEGKARIAFSDLSLNGKIVNLTGRNNSGKSTLMLSLLDSHILAQCGLPVFAKSAKLSPRTHFAMSFLDRDSQLSTFTAKTKKDMAILSLLSELNSLQLKRVLVFVDELGSATDQVGVIDVVTPLIDCLHKVGVSVVMSTQIPEVSRYIETTHHGSNYRFVGSYKLEPGIGYAEPVEVAKELGYFDLLKVIENKVK